MKTKTVAQILLRARQWADAETTDDTVDFVPGTEELVYLNEAYEEMVDEILDADGWHLLLTHTDLTSPWSLSSAGVYRDMALAVLDSDGKERDLPRFNFATRNQACNPDFPTWRILGGAFKFYPASPTSSLTLRLWFIPDLSEFDNDADTVPVFGGWQTYLSLRIAQKMLAKEERINGQVDDEFKLARKRVIRACQELHIGRPEQVPDTMVVAEDYFDDDLRRRY